MYFLFSISLYVIFFSSFTFLCVRRALCLEDFVGVGNKSSWTCSLIHPNQLLLPQTAVLSFQTLQNHSDLNVSFLISESSVITFVVRRRYFWTIIAKFPCIPFQMVSVVFPVATLFFLHLPVLLAVCIFFFILSQNKLMLCLPTCITSPDFSIGLSWCHWH